MKAGFSGTFVISWSQTEVDGLEAAPVHALSTGSAWSWRGNAIRVDGPADVLRLDQAMGSEDLRKRAARMVHRLVGAALDPRKPSVSEHEDEPLQLADSSFVVTDGAQSFTVTLIHVGPGRPPLLMFLDEMPPRDIDLWIVHLRLGSGFASSAEGSQGGAICFTPGTWLRTPDGQVLLEDLRVGDLLQTKDNGPQPIEWIGSRRMSGARLFAMPKLRPIRFRAGALGIGQPEEELLVSPDHRMVVTGPAAQALFNTPEVLVAAKDLVNGRSVAVDLNLREVTYVHLMLSGHNIVWANGVETESFHPASAALPMLGEADRARLLAHLPALARDPFAYGGYARRNLSASEAAILTFAA